MKEAIIWVDTPYLGNKIFSEGDPYLNRDDCLRPYIELKNELKLNSIDLKTQDLRITDPEFIIFNDMSPLNVLKSLNGIKKFLIIFESEIIKPQNWNLKLHKYFEKIFTWNDDIIDNKKYFKINFANNFIFPESFKSFSDRSIFSLIIAGNKMVMHEKELYSERLKTIRWFEKNSRDDFKLFGFGWDMVTFKGFARPLNRIPGLRKFLGKNKFPSYCGKVDSKFETLSNAKFSICYENAKDITGYITEKIFDCFFAGCIPVYWGISNPSDVFGDGTFIDRRKFNSHEDLLNYLKNISEEEYTEIQENILKFCFNEKNGKFSNNFFVKQISEQIL